MEIPAPGTVVLARGTCAWCLHEDRECAVCSLVLAPPPGNRHEQRRRIHLIGEPTPVPAIVLVGICRQCAVNVAFGYLDDGTPLEVTIDSPVLAGVSPDPEPVRGGPIYGAPPALERAAPVVPLRGALARPEAVEDDPESGEHHEDPDHGAVELDDG